MIVSHHKSGQIDPTVYKIIEGIESDVPIVPVTRLENYVFNTELLKYKDVILFDFVEYNWNWDMADTHFFGFNTYKFRDLFEGKEWEKFDDWVRKTNVKVYFKREILIKDVSGNKKPVEYPCWHVVPPAETREQFNARVLSANFVWGLSHEDRKRVHADIWIKSGEYRYVVCDNIENVFPFAQQEHNPIKILTANVPHYARHPIQTIIDINQNSKISLSLSGAGRKCFRHTESPVNSTMLLWEDNIAWGYEWVHNVNCIRAAQGEEVSTIIEALNNPFLYDIYLAGIKTCKNYEFANYIKNYILPIINKDETKDYYEQMMRQP